MAKPPANLEELVRRIVAHVGAAEAAAFFVKTDFISRQWIRSLLHVRPDNSDPATRAAAIAAFREIVAPCVRLAKDGAIRIEGSDNDQGQQFCLVTLARRDVKVVGAAAFIVRCVDLQAATAMLMRIQRATFLSS